MQTEEADGSTSSTTTTDCGSSTPSKRPREIAPIMCAIARPSRSCASGAWHQTRLHTSTWSGPILTRIRIVRRMSRRKFHQQTGQQNIVDEAFATFLAKHNIDARVFRSEEWAAVEEAIDQGSAESWSELVKLLCIRLRLTCSTKQQSLRLKARGCGREVLSVVYSVNMR